MGGYPSTNITLVNNSIKTSVPATGSNREKVILMAVSSSDKGYEDFRLIEGTSSDYTKVYGNISFAKHGQPQIQAAAVLDAGASIYHKRIVSPTSTLAHVALDVTVTKTKTQKTNSEGALLYKDADGVETTEAEGNTPIMITGAKLKFGTSGVTGQSLLTAANDHKEIGQIVKASYTGWATADPAVVDSIKFPWFVVTETGRGASNKKIKIVPDYASSKSASWTKYNLEVLEDNTSVDNVLIFSMNPDTIDSSTNENRFIDTVISKRSSQLRCVAFEDCIDRMYEVLAAYTGKTVEFLKENDILFGRTRKGYNLEGIIIDEDGVNLNSLVGIDLANGSNGALGFYPKEVAEYETLLTSAFNGTSSVDIYDINNNRVNAIFDADYPASTKRAIEALVTFREDIFYFRDLGTGLTSLEDIIQADTVSLKNKFCASYHNSYDIYEPVTKKQVTVTCMYDLAPKFINHELNGISRPFAGLLYGITFSDSHIVQDSINFIPKKIPGYNQFETLADAKINYMVKYNGILTMDTEFTSDEVDSDFSFINNILLIQDLIRLIRVYCPKRRYTFKTGDDYVAYKKDVDNLLNSKKSAFESVTVEFMADEEQRDDHGVYAALSVKCKDFIDKEYFKIIAI